MPDIEPKGKRGPTEETLKLGGAEVVLAISVSGEKDENGQRGYQTWVRGPVTNHTNAEMIQLLALLAMTPTLGNAMSGAISLQEAIDSTKHIFGVALESWVHDAVAKGNATEGLTTVKMEREAPSS